MGALKLTYYQREEALEKSSLFVVGALEKKCAEQKKRVRTYGYGFNGHEKDDNIKGDGNSLDFGARIYDPRLGRWLSMDPDFSLYPGINPYNYCLNIPIRLVDNNGENATISIDYSSHTITMSSTIYLVGKNAGDVAAQNLQSLWDAGSKSYKIKDPNNPDVVWTVKVDIKFVYSESVDQAAEAMGVNTWEGASSKSQDPSLNSELNIGKGDNILIMSSDGSNKSEGQATQGGNVGVSESSGATGIHESLHLMGMDERYFKTGNGALEFAGLESDWLSSGDERNTLMGFHYVDLLDFAISESGGVSKTFDVASTSIDFKVSFFDKSIGMNVQSTTQKTTRFNIDNTNSGKNPSSGVSDNNKRIVE